MRRFMPTVLRAKTWAVLFVLALSIILLGPAYALAEKVTVPQTRRIVQVDLNAHPKISQYDDIDSTAQGYGKNACGLVAAAAAVGGENWQLIVERLANAAGDTYHPERGIQPSAYAAALQKTFGADQVRTKNNSTILDLFHELQAGNTVIVDLKVNVPQQAPSASPPNYAHFARVLGIDLDRQEIYIENTILGAPYWTVSLEQFQAAWSSPETTSSIIPAPSEAEPVTRWAVLLDGALRAEYAAHDSG